jgi:hypothetical protein
MVVWAKTHNVHLAVLHHIDLDDRDRTGLLRLDLYLAMILTA